MNLLMNKKWEGLEKLPAGGFIAAPNHCTEIDPLVVAHMLYNQNRMPHFLAKAGLFKVPVLGTVLRNTQQIPVERSIRRGEPLSSAGQGRRGRRRCHHHLSGGDADARSRTVAYAGTHGSREDGPRERNSGGADGALGRP